MPRREAPAPEEAVGIDPSDRVVRALKSWAFGKPLKERLAEARDGLKSDLSKLEEQSAGYGIDVPVAVLNQIESAESGIAEVRKMDRAVDIIEEAFGEKTLGLSMMDKTTVEILVGNAVKGLKSLKQQDAAAPDARREKGALIINRKAFAAGALVPLLNRLAESEEAFEIWRGINAAERVLEFSGSEEALDYITSVANNEKLTESEKTFLLAASAGKFVNALFDQAHRGRRREGWDRVREEVRAVMDLLPGQTRFHAKARAVSEGAMPMREEAARRRREAGPDEATLPVSAEDAERRSTDALLDSLGLSFRYQKDYAKMGEEEVIAGRRLAAQELFFQRGVDLPMITVMATAEPGREFSRYYVGVSDELMPCRNFREFSGMLEERYKEVSDSIGVTSRRSLFLAVRSLANVDATTRDEIVAQTAKHCERIRELTGGNEDFLKHMLVATGQFEVLAAQGWELLT